MQLSVLNELIARQRPGWSLEQSFYISEEIFDWERRGWLADQWYVVGHSSEVPDAGAFIVRQLLGESIIIVRQSTGKIGGYYNVCRHRGSRLCDHDGRASSFVCPYHGWSFRLDGSVRAIPAKDSDLDLGQLALHPVPVLEVGGILLASLNANPDSLSSIETKAAELLSYHGVPQARIAARRSYPTHANWKLVMENFAECYHCYPAHQEYCSVMQHVEVLARRATESQKEAWLRESDRWYEEEADPHSPAGNTRPNFSLERARHGISRAPIGGRRKTQSQDGEPVAPLMGRQSKFDGGVGSFYVSPFSYVFLLNDHAVMFHFLPVAAQETDVTITWLVSGSARDEEVDAERLIWMWDVTTVQDKALIERNAQGVRSRAYQPGPYSRELEFGPDALLRRYLAEFHAASNRLSSNRDAAR